MSLNEAETIVKRELLRNKAANMLPVAYQPVLDWLENKEKGLAQTVDYSPDVAGIIYLLNSISYKGPQGQIVTPLLGNLVSPNPSTPTNNGFFENAANTAPANGSQAASIFSPPSIANANNPFAALFNPGNIPNGSTGGPIINLVAQAYNNNGKKAGKKPRKTPNDKWSHLLLDDVHTFEFPVEPTDSIKFMTSWNIDRMEIDHKRRIANHKFDEEQRQVDNYYINRIGLTRMPQQCYPPSDLSRKGPKLENWSEFLTMPFSMRKAYYERAAHDNRGNPAINCPRNQAEFNALPPQNKTKATGMEFITPY